LILARTPAYRDHRRLEAGNLTGRIDDKTLEDLELERIFDEIDRTRSTPGQSLLYAWLINQCLDAENLSKRSRLINAWFANKDSHTIRKILGRCGFQDRGISPGR